MTFNQWCCGKTFSTSTRIAFEDVWNQLISGGCSPTNAGRLLSDLHACIIVNEDEDWQ